MAKSSGSNGGGNKGGGARPGGSVPAPGKPGHPGYPSTVPGTPSGGGRYNNTSNGK